MIVSLTSADAEFNHWVAENSYRHLSDLTGDIWELDLRLEQRPHPHDVVMPLYRLHIRLTTEVSGVDLVKAGVLNKDSDRRLLDLIGDDEVPLAVKTLTIEGKSLDRLRSDLASYIYKLRNTLKKRDLTEVKRRLVGSWIDRKSLFGHALSEPPDDKIDLDV